MVSGELRRELAALQRRIKSTPEKDRQGVAYYQLILERRMLLDKLKRRNVAP